MNTHNDPNLRQGPGKPVAKHSQAMPMATKPSRKPGQAANEHAHTKLSEAVQPHHQGPSP
jgi:hypothetical protein